MTTYVGLAIADSMFPEDVLAIRKPLSVDELKILLKEDQIVSCCNPSHQLTLDALATKYGIIIPVIDKAPFVKLQNGDRMIVLSARFPRRLNEGEVWSKEDVDKAEFKFGFWTAIV